MEHGGADSKNSTRVLVVDDEELVADTFTAQLSRWYDVEAAYGGAAALEAIDDEFDVVLLDRRMPTLSGDEVLREIRDRGLDVKVVAVTAVDADFDVLDMPCDGYVEKPVDGDGLEHAVERQLKIREYDDRVAEFFAISDKVSALETQKPQAELDANERYGELVERREELRAGLDDLFDQIDESWLML